MSTVYIMVEGPTEEEFTNNSISHYLRTLGIENAVPILLETSPGYFGGDISFVRYEKNAKNLLLSDPNAVVTSLIDYYQLRNDFPGYAPAMAITDKNERVAFLEEQIFHSIANDRFLPYIQLHEFEGLLFSDIRGFNYVHNIPPKNRGQIQYIINNYPNPELINDGADSAPSVRLGKLIPRYRKPFHGPLIALENGLEPVLAKCHRFRNWINTIAAKAAR